MKDTWRDKIALLLWRDRDGYDPSTGCVGDGNNVSVRTRFRTFKKWIADGWIVNWKWWVTTLIATAATAAAITPLYLNLPKPGEQMDAHIGELLRSCIQQGKCIVRVEAVGQGDNKIITGPNANRLNQDGTPVAAEQKPKEKRADGKAPADQ